MHTQLEQVSDRLKYVSLTVLMKLVSRYKCPEPLQLCTRPKTTVTGTPQSAFTNVQNFHALIMIGHNPYLKR